MRALLFLATACLALTAVVASENKVVCYFGSWSVYRPGNGKFDIGYIDPSLCTHLVYTFVGLQGNDVKVLDAWQDLPDNWGKDGFGRFNALREKYPNVKTMIAIGGWNEGSVKYSQMASNAASRELFADNVVKFVKKYNFDGFDLDWEYPAQRGGAPSDVDNYIELLKVLKERLSEEGLILSAAVAAAESSASKSFKIAEMSKHLDIINIMAYDLHGAWESVTGINAPLRPAAGESEDNEKLTVEACAKYWIDQGADKEKLVLGMPLYGRAFQLADPADHSVGAPTRGPGAAGPYTRERGMIGYNEICEMHLKGGWNIVFDEERRVPYTYKGDQWIGYDNVKSIREKAELVKKLGLGGAMVWSVETDDFHGICGEKYPLLKTINSVLRGGPAVPEEPAPPAIPEPVPTTQNPNPPSSSGGSGKCEKVGLIKDPDSCGFIRCSPGADGWQEDLTPCPEGTCFDESIGNCNWLN